MVRMLRICVIVAVFCSAGSLFMPTQPLPGEAPGAGLNRAPGVPLVAPGMPPRGGSVGVGNRLRRNYAVLPRGVGGAGQAHIPEVPAGGDGAVVPGGE